VLFLLLILQKLNNVKIKEFVKQILKDKSNKLQKFSFGKLTEKQIKEIKENTGFDLTDYERIIDNYGIKYAFKQHGNIIKEQKRGQIAITENDFENILKIITNAEKIENNGKNKIGRNIIRFCKQLSEKNYYTEEIMKKKKELAMQTFYKRKNR